MEFIQSKKVWKRFFFGCGKIFVMPGVGPRPACHIPEPRDCWQQCTLWFSHVIVSLPVNPGLLWYLKTVFCCMEFIQSKKVWKRFFFGCGKIFVMPGVGPRPACHIPEPRDSWQQCTLWFSHVIVSLPVNPGLQWHLKIGFC